ncbi:MAG: hypothetical protein PHW60_02575 [Kiritimatiellae bacterium]|nr:hypothetical protein [Kiritimatiellia bacterium]
MANPTYDYEPLVCDFQVRATIDTNSMLWSVVLAPGNTFAVYQPVYGKSFNVRDAAAEMSTLLELGKLDLPPAARKEIQRAGVDVLDRLTGVPEDRKKLILDAIAASDALPSAEERQR